MRAYDKVYQALLGGKPGDATWKKKVDDSIQKYLDAGQSRTEAVKSAAVELNSETTIVERFEGFFLKSFTNFDKQVVINAIQADGTVAQIVVGEDGQTPFALPQRPSTLIATKLEKTRYLLSNRTEYKYTPQTTIETAWVSPEKLAQVAKLIENVADGEYALILATVTEVVAFKDKPMVTPEKINLKLNFKSGQGRSGLFVRDLETLKAILPSESDVAKFNNLTNAQDWEGMLAFVNSVCGANRDLQQEGLEILLYGQVNDNDYTDRKGNPRTGKNFRLTSGAGFIYCFDILYDDERAKNAPNQAVLPMAAVAPEPSPAPASVPVPAQTKLPEPAVTPFEVPEGAEDIDAKILKIIGDAGDGGITPIDIVKKANVATQEVTSRLSAGLSAKIILKEGKFRLRK